ncbi:hypothetical protein, partial [Candidatus Liberibacter solanacearum]
MVNPLVIGAFFSGLAGAISKYKEGKQSAEADRYRVSLAEENAKRADFLHLEREERAKREGILDAGLFQMKAEMSGLSGVSADLWIGQRYRDVHRDVYRERISRQQTVSRFLKEANWHQNNADASEVNKWWGMGATAITTAAKMYKAS